jgi:NADPH:quinone reductase-like Zn-dependent oxidoreductase
MNAADPESLGRLGVEGTNVLAYASSPQDLAWLAQLVSNGELKVPISQVFALEETGQALAKLQTGEVQGKIVLDCSPG